MLDSTNKFSTADPLVFHPNFMGLRTPGHGSKQKFVSRGDLEVSLELQQRGGRHNFGPLKVFSNVLDVFALLQ
jgi:hypothetical protein